MSVLPAGTSRSVPLMEVFQRRGFTEKNTHYLKQTISVIVLSLDLEQVFSEEISPRTTKCSGKLF